MRERKRERELSTVGLFKLLVEDIVFCNIVITIQLGGGFHF